MCANDQVPTGKSCWNVDFEKLGVGLKNGSEITLQLKYDGVSHDGRHR